MPANNVTRVALSVAPEVIKMTVAENASYSNGYAAGYAAGEAAHAGDYKQGYDAGYAAGEEAHAGDYQQGYDAGYAAGEAAHEEDYQRGYQVGYTAGYAAGEEAHAKDYQNGYDAGYAAGEAAHAADYQNGYNAGYAAGEAAHAEDYQNGYDKGYAEGEAAHAEDYQNGYDAGYAAGEAAHAEDYQTGYNEGYTKGHDDGAEVRAEELEKARQQGYDEGHAAGEEAHAEDYQNGYDTGYSNGYSEGYDAGSPVVMPFGGTPARLAVNPDAKHPFDVSMLLSDHSDHIFQMLLGRITLDVSALGVPGYESLALTFADEVITWDTDPETGEEVMSEHQVTFSAMRDSANYAYLTYGTHGLIDLAFCLKGKEMHFSAQQALQFPLTKPSWVMRYDTSQIGPEPAPKLAGQVFLGDNSIEISGTEARWLFTPEANGAYNISVDFSNVNSIRYALRDASGITLRTSNAAGGSITIDYEMEGAANYYLDLHIGFDGPDTHTGLLTITTT